MVNKGQRVIWVQSVPLDHLEYRAMPVLLVNGAFKVSTAYLDFQELKEFRVSVVKEVYRVQ